MLPITALSKKLILAVLILAVGMAAFPITAASAAGIKSQALAPTDNSRLENLWASQQARYRLQGDRISSAADFIAWVQTLITRAKAKGWDTSSIQAGLNGLSAAIPSIQAAHAAGAAIIASHAGFDAAGKVTDRTTAIATLKSLAQVLKDTRVAASGSIKTFRIAVRAFRQAHRRTPAASSSTQ